MVRRGVGGWNWWTSRPSGGPLGWCVAQAPVALRKAGCSAGTVTEQDSAIAPPPDKLTTRAGRWATRQAGRARPVDGVAAELGCSWHRVNASARRLGSFCWQIAHSRVASNGAEPGSVSLAFPHGSF